MPIPVAPRVWLALTSLLCAEALAGCAVSPAVRAAEQGSFEGLRASISADVQQGRMGIGDAAAFAKAIARGEIARAKGPEGAQRIRRFESCAREIDGALDNRADTHDDLGAVAATVRVDAGIASPSSFSRWARTSPDSPEAAWRALGARSLTSGGSEGVLRRQMIADPDEEVRRGALRAALEAADPEDTEVVLEAARVDPSPAARAQAIRAAGVIGGERSVLALKDIWPRADESTRESIVDAWATHASFNAGGRRELLWVLARNHDRAALAAASALIRAGGDGAVEGQGALERAIKEGPTDTRTLAIAVAPRSIPALREAISKAETDPDEAVAVAAMVRRFEADPPAKVHEEIAQKLLKIAEAGGLGAVGAKGALARAHDRRLLPILERDGASKDERTRESAGVALAVYGDLPRAAIVAADLVPSVRVEVACAILRAWAAK
ncbi:PBS lyase HEAT domain protein repeat-containing protein [Minicystis rosea]|nr:PBS lyase HEAT domain protein repeat-containing protein [Minicystis rosea]